MQRFVEQDSGVIAGERSPGAVCSVHAGSETDDQQSRLGISKWRDRLGVVLGVLTSYLRKMARQPWAVATISREFHASGARGCGFIQEVFVRAATW